jgi:fido (protein-threonine AMPylation protein)
MYSATFLPTEDSITFHKNLFQFFEKVDHKRTDGLFYSGLLLQEDLEPHELTNLKITLDHVRNLKQSCLGFLDVDDCIVETHRLLMQNIHDRNGEFSTDMRFTSHFHPRFSRQELVYEALQFLCDIVNEIQNEITSIEEHSQRLQQKFKLASLFLCSFLEIHPFSDGNGRTATILANYILGDDLPFFAVVSKHRNRYIDALKRSRKCERNSALDEINYKHESLEVINFITRSTDCSSTCKLMIESVLEVSNEVTS